MKYSPLASFLLFTETDQSLRRKFGHGTTFRVSSWLGTGHKTSDQTSDIFLLSILQIFLQSISNLTCIPSGLTPISDTNDTDERICTPLQASSKKLRMANPTAARWFARDNFLLNPTDYAFPGQDCTNIKRDLRGWDTRVDDNLPWTYYGFVRASDKLPCYECAPPGALVFADVKGTAKHKEDVQKIRADNVLTEAEVKLVKQRQRNIREKLATIYKPNEGDEEDVVSEKDQWMLKHHTKIDGARLRSEVVSFVLSAPTAQAKADVLDLFSGEGRYRRPRPTLMIIQMFDEARATRCGESSGYVIAYDFLSNQIIIKHWKSSLDHHPLSQPWFAEPPNDGVSYLGSPSDLLLQLSARKGLVKGSPTYGFGLLTRFMAGRWLFSHFTQLGLVPTAASHESHARLKSLLSKFAEELDTLEVLGVKTDSYGRKKDTNYREPQSDDIQELYAELLVHLEGREWGWAAIAVEEREEGNSKAAENLAEFYDRVARTAKTLLIDPEASFSFEGTGL